MNTETQKGYYKGLCNRLHDLFIHYSAVRMIILSFCIPLGAILIAEGNQYQCAGILVIFIAWVLNLYFARMSINRWLEYRNIDLWLKWGDTAKSEDEDYERDYEEKNRPGYFQLLFCPPKKENFNNPPMRRGKNWKDEWEKILKEARRHEWVIQGGILFGVAGLLCFLGVLPKYFSEVMKMSEELRWVIAIVLAFLGIALTMMAFGWSAHYQAEVLEKPEEKTDIARKLRIGSWLWYTGACFYFALVIWIMFLLVTK